MKTTKFFALALAVLALGACSSDDVIGQKEPAITGGEKGYVSISVNMPTQPTGRAFDETLDDGLPSEYKVNDATLLLFSGATEDGATFASAYNLDATGFAMNGGSTDQITSNATLVQEVTVPKTTNNDNIYALVVLNNNGKITVGAEGALTVGGEKFTGTFKDFYGKTLTLKNGADDITGNGIFMSNAPLYSKPGGASDPTGGAVSTLTVIDKNKIYTTEAEASSNPAANIYVERAVAKVTVNASDGSAQEGDGSNPNLASYEVEGWAFNVANTKTYPVRNVANGSSWWALKAADQYRFVGNVAVATNLYRTYFGEDPNYSTYSAGDFIIKSGEDLANTTLFGFGANNPGYCLENTFDVDNMINNRTTQVVVKAKLTLDSGLAEDDGSFYVLNGNTSTIYKKDGVVATVQGRIADWLQANWDTYFDADRTIQGTAIDVVLSNATTDEGGVITITSATLAQDDLDGLDFKDGQTLETLNAGIAKQVTALNEDGLEISYYKGGYAYYPILIKHFGDDQTPWTEETSNTSGAYEGAEANANWLGRYGVLRNNWYDITVTGIKNIGSPSVPDITGDTDDPESRYIAVSINVLSWTKRTQSADL